MLLRRYSSGNVGEDSAAEDVDMLDAEQQRGGSKRKGKGKGSNPRAEANRELERQQAEMEDATIRCPLCMFICAVALLSLGSWI